MERRLAAILAADVAGYTHLTELNDEATAATFRSYRTVVEEVIRAHHGRVFSRAGDEVVAEFPSVVEAIRCAVDIQHEVADRNATGQEATRMQFRIGVNLGDVIAEEEGIYGTGVNLAARLEQLAEPGGICVSQSVYDQVRKIVEMSFQDIGAVRLKNIDDPVRVYRIVSAPLPWFRRMAPRSGGRRLGTIASVALLILAALSGLAYLSHPLGFYAALVGGPGQPPLPEQPSLAVLSFADLSATRDEQYLADGVTEELVTGLAKFPDLLVVARNSNFTSADETTDVRVVGRDLNVRYVVKGSLQRSDQNVRVTAQLIDATTGRQIWADRYDRKVDNIFDIRDDITRSVVGTIMGTNGKLAAAEIARLSAKDPTSFTAYDYLMRGWSEWSQFTREGNLAAREYFEKAKDLDPNYAQSYTGLAWTYSSDYDFNWTDDYDTTLQLTLEMAEKAVSLDNNDYRSHWALGWAYLYSRQFEKALASYGRARELNPNDAELLAEMANMLIYVGQPEQAIEQVKEAMRLNPFHEDWYPEYLARAYEDAAMPLQAVQTLEPVLGPNPTENDLWILPTLAAAYADPTVNRVEDAREVVKLILALDPEFSISSSQAREPYRTKEHADRLANAMRRAGLPD